MKFCSHCAAPVAKRWIDADARERFVCTACGRIHYQNPRILVVCIVEHEGRILMCQRAHAPSVGLWTPPSGFMELGETLEEAAAREVREETGVEVGPGDLDLHMISNVPWTNEVYVGFRARVNAPVIRVGPESLEARFFDESDIPWDRLAFPETVGYLHLWIKERAAGHFGIHITRIDADGGHRREYQIDRVVDVFKADALTSRPASSVDRER